MAPVSDSLSPGPHGITRNNFIAAGGEFVGTFMFLFCAFAGTQIANASVHDGAAGPDPMVLLYIAFSFGISLTVNVWVFYRITGGMFNPVVSLALALVGAITPMRAVMVTFAQLVAAITAAAVVTVLFPGPLLVSTRLGGGTSGVQGVFIEMFLTSLLVITILMLAVVKHRATPLAPVGIGFALFVIQLSGVYYTGGSVNPARSFGPDVVNLSFPGYHYIYWVGPLLGSLLAVGYFHILKLVKYQTCNPGQDFDGIKSVALDDSTQNV